MTLEQLHNTEQALQPPPIGPDEPDFFFDIALERLDRALLQLHLPLERPPRSVYDPIGHRYRGPLVPFDHLAPVRPAMSPGLAVGFGEILEDVGLEQRKKPPGPPNPPPLGPDEPDFFFDLGLEHPDRDLRQQDLPLEQA